MANTEMGAAYLSIYSQISKDFTGNIDSAVGKAVQTVGKIAKAVAAAFAVKKVVDFGKAALDAFSDYEQLAGGAQKIFDEIDYSHILDDAKNAYVNLNMSANEYMASINQVGATFAQTMGDAQGYETAKMGMQAISDYATGTGRSIEELNEKYSMITRASSSYQSIADQFSGILPATSKDFLEQAQAAGFLSGEYKKLTDVPVAEYQQAVTEMLAQGVDQLGLTGNTAAEATKTVAGSMLMLKGAWANWLASLGTDDMDTGEMTQGLVDSVTAVGQNVVPKVAEIFGTLISEMPTLIGSVASQIPGLVEPILRAAIDTIGASLTDLLGALGVDVPEGFLSFDTVMTAFDSFVAWIKTGWDAFMSTFDSAGFEVALSNVKDIIAQVVGFVQERIVPLMPTVGALLGTVVSAIGKLIANILGVISALGPVVGTVFGWLIDIYKGIADFVLNSGTTFDNMKQTIINIWNTIKSTTSNVWNAIKTAVSTVVNTIFTVISTVWNAINFAVTSAVNGIKLVVTTVWNTIKNTITTVMNGISTVISTVWGAITGTVSSVINGIKTTVTSVFNGLKTTVKSIWDGIKSAITSPIESAKDTISSTINTISGIITGANLKLPSIPLPHFKIDGGSAPWGIGGLGKAPSFDVQWYAKGGIVPANSPRLIGVGDANEREVIQPESKLAALIAQAVSEGGADTTVVAWLARNLGPTIRDYAPALTEREAGRLYRRAAA